jgi:hypothetical protein
MSSSIVCRNTESAVIPTKVSHLWEIVKRLDFAVLMPGIVKACHLLIPESSAHQGQSREVISLDNAKYSSVPVADSASVFACATAVGSLRRVVYKDNAEFIFRIVEISDIHRQVAYELIQTDASVNVTSVLHTIQLIEITETNESLINWTTEFSGDCDSHVYSDCKYKKLDAFKDMRKIR